MEIWLLLCTVGLLVIGIIQLILMFKDHNKNNKNFKG